MALHLVPSPVIAKGAALKQSNPRLDRFRETGSHTILARLTSPMRYAFFA
jgi:hypothetical protein